MQPGWPSHIRTNGKSIFFGVNSSPFASSRHLGEPLKGSAIQESPTSNVFQRGRDGQLNEGVEEANPLEQSATVTRVRSNSCKILREEQVW